MTTTIECTKRLRQMYEALSNQRPFAFTSKQVEGVTDIIVHRQSMIAPCADGRAAAYIAHFAIPKATIREMPYNCRAHIHLEAKTGYLFADFSPHPKTVEKLKPFDPIILDHHKSVKDVLAKFPNAIFADEDKEPGVSGAMLAYREIYWPMAINDGEEDWLNSYAHDLFDLAYLVGIRDTFLKDDPQFEKASNLSEYLKFVPMDQLLDMPVSAILANGQTLGPVIRGKTIEDAKRAVETATRLTISGNQLVLFNDSRLATDAAQFVSPQEIVVAYDMIHDGNDQKIQFSMRTARKDIDLGALAKKTFGGGGHSRAAGFSVDMPACAQEVASLAFFNALSPS